MTRRIPTVNVAVAMTVPTIHRTSRVSRFAISVRTPAIPVCCVDAGSEATAPRWQGERLDLGWALGVLWRPRAGADPAAGVPAGTSGP